MSKGSKFSLGLGQSSRLSYGVFRPKIKIFVELGFGF